MNQCHETAIEFTRTHLAAKPTQRHGKFRLKLTPRQNVGSQFRPPPTVFFEHFQHFAPTR
jgi:hypothetical protein